MNTMIPIGIRLLLLALCLSACLPESVEVVVLTPESPEIEFLLRAADERWEKAGVAPERIQIGPGGARVRYVPERAGISETRVTWSAGVFRGVKWMELDVLNVDVATHELGHALGIGRGLVSHPIEHEQPEACEPDATNRPLMCSRGGVGITERDLTLACDIGDCTHFTPEVVEPQDITFSPHESPMSHEVNDEE